MVRKSLPYRKCKGQREEPALPIFRRQEIKLTTFFFLLSLILMIFTNRAYKYVKPEVGKRLGYQTGEINVLTIRKKFLGKTQVGL